MIRIGRVRVPRHFAGNVDKKDSSVRLDITDAHNLTKYCQSPCPTQTNGGNRDGRTFIAFVTMAPKKDAKAAGGGGGSKKGKPADDDSKGDLCQHTNDQDP